MAPKVEGVINLCEEYRGPDRTYRKLGIRHLHLPTTDHFEPSLEHLKTAVHFIAEHEASGKKVYVHCRAGHGRSAAVVFAWLLSKNPKIDLKQLNRDFCQIRNVRKTLYKQRNILRFHTLLQNQKGDIDNDDETQLFSDESEDEL
jgi:atypical dual specificity phosphatase